MENINTVVSNILSTNGIKFSIGQMAKGVIRDKWECDQWRVNINGQSFDYFTGIGHRNKFGQTKMPGIAGIMHSLLTDDHCGSMSHYDFCDELEYDRDSISHMNIYIQCQNTVQKLNQCGIRGSIKTQLSEALQDY